MKRFSKEVGLAQVLAFSAVVGVLKKSVDIANEYDASQRSLASSAKLAGVSLNYLQGISTQVQQQFKLSSASANEFSSEIIKLTGKAGDLSKSSAALAAFLDIGAARGLDAITTLQRLQQVVIGVDRGFDLFGENASVLYAKYAKQIGTTVGKMSEMQKAQAIINRTLSDGAKVRGAYQEWLNSAAGQQYLLSKSVKDTGSALGHALQPVLVAILPVLTKLSDVLGWIINFLVDLARGFHATATAMAQAAILIKGGYIGGVAPVFEDWKKKMGEIIHGAKQVGTAMGNIPNLPTHTDAPPRIETPTSTYDAAAARNDIYTEDALARSRMYADLGLKQLGTEGSIADKMRIQLALAQQLYAIQAQSVQADTRLSSQQKANELLKLDLEKQREIYQIQHNALLDEELAKQQQIAEAMRRRNDAITAGASAIVGSVASGHPSGSAIGAGIGTALSWLPGGQVLPAVGGFIGGLFDGDKQKEITMPVVKGLEAIERAQNETIKTIKSQTDALLNPESRLFNLPSTFTIPAYNPGNSVSTSYGPVSVVLNIQGSSDMSPTEIKRIAMEGVSEAMRQQRRTSSWSN